MTLKNMIEQKTSNIFTAIYKTSLISSIFVLILLAIFTLIKNKLINNAKCSYMSSLDDICEHVYNKSIEDNAVEDTAIEENNSVEDKTAVISKEDASNEDVLKNEDVSEDESKSVESAENYDNNWFTESIDNFFNKKEN